MNKCEKDPDCEEYGKCARTTDLENNNIETRACYTYCQHFAKCLMDNIKTSMIMDKERLYEEAKNDLLVKLSNGAINAIEYRRKYLELKRQRNEESAGTN